MPISRYDQPAEAQFINTYSPVPFDTMLKIGTMKQEQADKGMDREDSLRQSIASMKVAPADEKAYNEKITEAYKILDEGTKYGVGSQDHMNAVRKATNFLAEDPEMRMMAQNYPGYAAAATALKQAEGEFGKNSPQAYKLAKQLRGFNEGAEGVTGTRYLMSQGGTGYLQAEGVGTAAPMQPILDEYLKPVKADMVAGEGIDASGNFIIGTEKSQITPNKLGSVLGIRFDIVVEGGKQVAKVDRNNINYPRDIDSTPAGVAMRAKAEQWADNSNGELSEEEAFKQLYADAAVRSINSHASLSSKMTLDANPFALASFKKKLDDVQPVITMPYLLGEQATGLNNTKAVEKAQDGIKTNIINIQSKRDEYKRQNNVAEGIDHSGAIDADNRSVSMVLAEFDAEAQQERDKLTSLENLVTETRADKKIPDKWKITDDFTSKELGEIEEDAWRKAQSVSKSTKEGGKDFKAIQEEYEKIYNETLSRRSVNFKRLNEGLKENAAAKLVEVGVTSFPTISSEKQMQSIVFKFTNEGVGSANRLGGGAIQLTEAGTGKPYDDKDYEKMARTTEEKYKPEVLGMFYDTKKGWPQVLIRAKDKNGAMLPAASMDAPAGTEDMFIRAGKIDAGSVMVQKALANIAVKADRTGSLGGDVDIKVLLPTTRAYNPSNASYEATFPNFVEGGKSTVTYTTREELVSKYIEYINAKAFYEETGKLPGAM